MQILRTSLRVRKINHFEEILTLFQAKENAHLKSHVLPPIKS